MKADRFVIRAEVAGCFCLISPASACGWSCRATRAQAKPLSGTWSGHRHSPWSRSRGKRRHRWFLERVGLPCDCGDLYYDLQGGGKPSLTVGQDVTFRIEKQKAYLDDGKNGERYNIVGTGKSD